MALPRRARAGGHLHGLVEVERPVGAQRSGCAHGAGEHDGLGGFERQVQQIGAFFQRVGAVGDDDAVHIALPRQRRHALRQLQALRVADVRRVQREQFMHLHLRQLRQLRHGLQQRLAPQGPGHVGGCRAVGACSGNGAARGEQGNAGQAARAGVGGGGSHGRAKNGGGARQRIRAGEKRRSYSRHGPVGSVGTGPLFPLPGGLCACGARPWFSGNSQGNGRLNSRIVLIYLPRTLPAPLSWESPPCVIQPPPPNKPRRPASRPC